MGKSKVIGDLARFGFTQYEAQAYMALLQHGILTGYELASKSGVPRSRIYEVLQHLQDKSVVSPVQGAPVRYRAQSAKMLLKSLETDMTRSLRNLSELLPQHGSSDSDFVWNIAERDELLAHAEQLILDAKSEILVYGFDQELEKLLPALRKKGKLPLAIVQLGNLEIDCGVLYQHLLPDQKRGEKGGRQFTLVTDDRNLLQGLVKDRQSCVGVWTTSPPLVDVARDFIRHDIFCWKLVSKLRGHVDKTFGADLALLRDIFCP